MKLLQKYLEDNQLLAPVIEKIYIDMDGVIVDDVSMFSMLEPTVPNMEALLKYLQITGKRQSYVLPRVITAMENNLFEQAPPTSFYSVLVSGLIQEWLDKGIEVAFLTSTMHTNPKRKELEDQKLAWLKKYNLSHLPVVFAEGSAKKQEQASPTTLLIDDYDRTIGQFRSKGGIAIQYTNLADVLTQLQMLGLHNTVDI